MTDQKPPHSFAQKFIHGNILSRFWGLVNTSVGLAASLVIIRALSVYQFGLYQLVLSATAFIGVIAVDFFDEVIKNDITRFLSDNKRAEAKRLFTELAVLKIGSGAFITAVLFFGSPVVAGFYGKDIGSFISIISFVVLIRAVRSTGSMFLGAIVSLRAIGAEAVESLSRLILILGIFIFSTVGIVEVLLATVAASTISLIYVITPFFVEYRSFFRGINARRQFMFKFIIKAYGLWVLLRVAIKRAAKPVQPWLIVTFLNVEAVALYALAANLVAMIKDFFPILSSSLLAWEVNNQERLRHIFSRSVKYSFLYGLVLAVGSFFFVPPLVGTFFPKYLPAMPLFSLFLIAVPFHGIQVLEAAILTALREQKVLAMRLFAEILMSFGLFIALVPVAGLLAAGIGAVVPIIWRTWFLYRQIIKKYPELRPDTQILFWFDAEDRFVAKRAFTEVKSFLKRYAPGFRWNVRQDENRGVDASRDKSLDHKEGSI